MTRPRRVSNQRVATVADMTKVVRPAASPTVTPHSATSCQSCVIQTEAAIPAAISTSEATITGLRPKRMNRAAAIEATRPSRARRKPSAEEISARVQANSIWSGKIITPTEPMAPAATSAAKKVTNATTHA